MATLSWAETRGRTRVALAALCALGMAILTASPQAALAKQDRDFEGSWHIPAGKTIEIHGVNGDILAEPSSSGETEVFAVKTARRSDPDEVKIEVIEHRGGITVCALYPGRGNRCGPGDDSHMNVRHNDVKVEFHVRVAKGVRFAGQTVNGRIEAEDLDGPVEATTVNGSVDISTGRTAQATTVNGSISAIIGVAHWDESLEFSTVNGGITVRFPPELSTRVRASTVNGHISTDFPLKVMGKISRRSIRGSVGDGEERGDLSLRTVNGTIRLRSSI